MDLVWKERVVLRIGLWLLLLLLVGSAALATEPEYELLYMDLFEFGDPTEGVWQLGGAGDYEYRTEESAYVRVFAEGGSGASLSLIVGEPHYMYWVREPQLTYVVEARLRFDRLGKYQSGSLNLSAWQRGYTVQFGSWADEYNVALIRRPRWDEPEAVVTHDGGELPLFDDGILQPEYASRWMDVRIIFAADRIDVYLDGEKILTYVDPEPIYHLSVAVATWAGDVAIEDVYVYIYRGPANGVGIERF